MLVFGWGFGWLAMKVKQARAIEELGAFVEFQPLLNDMTRT
jgi:hypothetical protein